MLNMGYPPPPIALEPLRRLLEQMTQGPGQVLNLQLAIHVTDEVSRSPYRIAPAVLFVLQQRLHSSKPDRVTLALELLDMCVKNCGLDFVRHINKEFMKSMVSVIKTTSFKDRTITGQMKKLEKYLIGSPSSSGVATDPRVHKLKRQCLSMIQNWADAFMMHPSSVQPILETYKSLRRKGVQFPPRDTTQKYLVKHAEESPAFESPLAAEASAGGVVAGGAFPANSVFTPQDAQGFSVDSFAAMETETETAQAGDCPFSERQFTQLEKLINLLRTSDDLETVERALEMCEQLRPKLEEALKTLTSRINAQQSRKLKGSDPRVAQLNAILDLDSEVKKRKGSRLIYGVSVSTPSPAHTPSPVLLTSQSQLVLPPIDPRLMLSSDAALGGDAVSFAGNKAGDAVSGNKAGDAVSAAVRPPPVVNLLDDLLDAPDDVAPSPPSPAVDFNSGINAITTCVEFPKHPQTVSLPSSAVSVSGPSSAVSGSAPKAEPAAASNNLPTDFWSSSGAIDFSAAVSSDPFATLDHVTPIEDFFVRPAPSSDSNHPQV
eukprot:Gregarina_sp_Pseudo_9__1519@NODE_201_length_3630_cov_7_755778_g186_i0_p2_GENE_NODE_201_length_3630_cov_7_755778_g186_i0NODE_201_length_3630_cov_7_755778_g186_i0_p2_ORF_typecomplete_len546_score194_88VHS/PF00790_19/8_2e19VHS/PF00790_19/3e02ENTH/PF01417_20/0_15Telomere_reg2/PF10193_9/3_5e02Telomere_reg2/PF10193_9/1Nbl1_Borealin_N/PF10444_9/0_87Nbl1_Borealin_N/PF10444_9/2_8e03_NODE_201_length_3630_cov_7_755778_g186_i0211658